MLISELKAQLDEQPYKIFKVPWYALECSVNTQILLDRFNEESANVLINQLESDMSGRGELERGAEVVSGHALRSEQVHYNEDSREYPPLAQRLEQTTESIRELVAQLESVLAIIAGGPVQERGAELANVAASHHDKMAVIETLMNRSHDLARNILREV